MFRSLKIVRGGLRSGIYVIRNVINGKLYVGSSADIPTRFKSHREYLRRENHDNAHLSLAWQQYGESAFEFLIIEFCAVDDLLIHEQAWIDKLHVTDPEFGYNMALIAGSPMRGRKQTTKFYLAHARAHKSRKNKPETIEKMRKSGGHAQTEETKTKISAIQRSRTPEQKLATANKLSAAHKRKWADPDYRARMLELDRRPELTPEYRENLSKAITKWWAERKARSTNIEES